MFSDFPRLRPNAVLRFDSQENCYLPEAEYDELIARRRQADEEEDDYVEQVPLAA